MNPSGGPPHKSFYSFYTKVTAAEFDSLPWEDYFGPGPFPDLIFSFTVIFVVIGTIGHGLLLTTVYRGREELNGTFYRLLALNSVFDWLFCLSVIPVVLFHQNRLCDPKYICLADSCVGSCPSYVSAIAYYHLNGATGCFKETGRVVSALITVNRVMSMAKPLKYRLYHNDKRVVRIITFSILVAMVTIGAGLYVIQVEFLDFSIDKAAGGSYRISRVRQDIDGITPGRAVGLVIYGFGFLLSIVASLICVVGWAYIVIKLCFRRHQHVQDGRNETARGETKILAMGGIVGVLTLVSIVLDFIRPWLTVGGDGGLDFGWYGIPGVGFNYTYVELDRAMKRERFNTNVHIYVFSFLCVTCSITFYILLLFVKKFREAFFKYVKNENGNARVVPIP